MFEWNNSDPTGQICMKFSIEKCFENSVMKIQMLLKSDNTRNYGYFR